MVEVLSRERGTASGVRRPAAKGYSEAPSPRVRILAGSEIAIGPGKADLLRAIDDTGSISAAARRMGMSYRRAWLLVHTMNDCFQSPLVEAAKGGAAGGGAQLTTAGRDVLRHYDDVARIIAERFAPYLRERRSRRGKGGGRANR
jgi:molybdate transport system regulatory protein